MRFFFPLLLFASALLLPATGLLLQAAVQPLEQARGTSLRSDLVKVRISPALPALRLSSTSGFVFMETSNRQPVLGTRITNLLVTVTNGRLVVDGQPLSGETLSVESVLGGIGFDGQRYRGGMLVVLEQGKLFLVNRIDMESYLKGVLPHEIDHRWPIEALKAQAIAARSYAIVRMRENKNKLYDLDNSAYSQVYRGMGGEKESTSDAVTQTAGLVLLHNGLTAVGFFHASCGGRTEASELVWAARVPYLVSRISPWCRGSRYYNWGTVLTAPEIARLLGISRPLASAAVLSVTPSGRVLQLRLVDNAGRRHHFSGKDFRTRLGYNRLRSQLFTVRVRGPYLQILGRGWGHGVGLCQWCARGMAAAGRSALEIMAHFYPGTTVGLRRVVTEW